MKYNSFFPHDNVREIQSELIKDVISCLQDKKHLFVHAPTGLGKCVGKDTLILTRNGLKKISEIYLDKVRVNSMSRSLKTSIESGVIIKKKRSQLYRIRTGSGRMVEATDDHKFLSIKGGSLIWKKLKELKKGDNIACSRKLHLHKTNVFFSVEYVLNLDRKWHSKLMINTIPSITDIIDDIKINNKLNNIQLAKSIDCPVDAILDIKRRNKTMRLDNALKVFKKAKLDFSDIRLERIGMIGRKTIKVPTINKEFAYFIGLLIGDGFISNSNKKEINFSNATPSLIAFFDKIAKKFGSKIRKKHGTNCKYDYLFNNMPLAILIYSLGFPQRNKSANVGIPYIFFNDYGLLSSVLSGIFDTDGSVFSNTTLELSTKSERLKDHVLHALLAFGIYPIIKEKYVKGKKYFRIYMCNTNDCKLFDQMIGFRHPEKQERLKSIVKKRSNSNLDVIPEIHNVIKKCREKMSIPYSRTSTFRIYESYAYKSRNPSKKGLKKLIKYFSNNCNICCQELKTLEMLADSDIFWDKIKDITKTKIDYVYDATIPETNNFIGNGIILHNTAASLPAALEYAMDKKLTVFFLTSRHTQHKIAIDTLKEIKKKHGVPLKAVDLIGKKWMCSKTVELLTSGEFSDYCKKLREDGNCEFYNNTKKDNKATPKAASVLGELKLISPSHVEELIDVSRKEDLCPYEIAGLMAREADIVIGDYNYIFNPRIRDTFLLKAGKELEKCIVIVDEAHNLPKRVRESMTVKVNSFILKAAVKEADKFKYHETVEGLNAVANAIDELATGDERLVKSFEFVKKVNSYMDYDQLVNDLIFIGDDIRDRQKRSFVASVGNFLEKWTGEDEGFARILSKYGENLELSYRCLDPSLLTSEVAAAAHSVIFMSGTLTPTFMYKDILGFSEAEEREFESPFPTENKLSLIVPSVTTKYTKRGEAEYKKMAKILVEITDAIPGNSAVFFPSYFLRDAVYKFLFDSGKKTLLLEQQGMTNSEKHEFLEKFKSYQKSGAVLLGVAAGSFGEGIDLPGDLLKGVIVVGLPLEKPNLEIKELISYYDAKFSKGWDYGYVFPAIQKVLQNAGRCIRSEKDKGVVVFLDERFAWPNYKRCIPKDFNVKVSQLYLDKVKEFFT